MLREGKIWAGQGENPCYLLLNQANRHGLISGASGTGKTVTLKVLAEGFSQAGVPVFMADVKGDVTGMAQPGEENDNVTKRVAKFNIEDWTFAGCPTRFWEVAGVGAGVNGAQNGIPVRLMVSQMGPTLLSRLLGLNDVQEGVLNIVFHVADDLGMLLIDLKDLRAMLSYVAEHSDEYTTTYGNVSAASVGAIQRALITVEDQGGNVFFGEPAIDLDDWFACDEKGAGYVNILNAERLIQSPQVYAMLLLWMMGDLFENLPELGDPEKPKFVFFFDEAHLLFNGMPKELLNKMIQVVKLIRSKGVGIYFITQSPSDIPDEVLAQLSNRIQHGLRAYTPAEQKAVKAAAASFRANPSFKSEDAILDLGTGEALVSFLDEDGRPSVVERAKILPPQCLMAAAPLETIEAVVASEQELYDKYATSIDRTSAYEKITGVAAPDGDDGLGNANEPTMGEGSNDPTSTHEPSTASVAPMGPWTCECGAENDSKFCRECGKERPSPVVAADGPWTCACGHTNEGGKFCPSCGAPRPEGGTDGPWTCECGQTNDDGKYCSGCGARRPVSAGVSWKCNCGHTNEGTKFCSSCGQSYEQGIMTKDQKKAADAEAKAAAAAKAKEEREAAKAKAAEERQAAKEAAAEKKEKEAKERAEEKKKEQREAQMMKTASSVIGQIGRTASSTLVRGFLNNLMK